MNVNEVQVEEIIARCERALAGDGKVNLRNLGFWKAVAAVERNPAWRGRFAERIASIDQLAFDRATPLRFPVAVGMITLAAASVAGVILAIASSRAHGRQQAWRLLAATALVTVSTHDLAHYLVGRLVRIRFSSFFLFRPWLPEPGLKIDYRSYLATPARARAWMHASGAIVTQVVAVLAFLLALLERAPRWATLLLGVMAAFLTLTEVFFSTRFSDWKRFRREMRVAEYLDRSR